MSFRLRNDRVQEVAAFQARNRVEMLTVVCVGTVGSTRLRQELGDAAARGVIREHDDLLGTTLRKHPESLEITIHSERSLIAFSRPSDAVAFALQLQRRVREWNRNNPHPLADRIGIHAGEMLIESPDGGEGVRDLNGLEVDRCERVMILADPGRILLTGPVYTMARSAMRGAPREDRIEPCWFRHGRYAFEGLAETLEIGEVAEEAAGKPRPPADSEGARRLPEVIGGAAAVSRGRVALGATIVAAVAALLLSFELGPFVAWSYDLAYWSWVRPTMTPPKEAIIIKMDGRSYAAEGMISAGRWDRAKHARLLNLLTTNRPLAVVLDTYLHPDLPEDQKANQLLVEAAKANDRVVVAAFLDTESKSGSHSMVAEPPFAALREVVRWGTVWVPRGARQVFPARGLAPTLPGEVLSVIRTNSGPSRARPEWLMYYGPRGTLRSVSYTDVLSGAEPAKQFVGRLVLVGADYSVPTAGGRSKENDQDDNRETPYTLLGDGLSPGVEVVATACLNLMREEGLGRLPTWLELVILCMTGMAAVVLVASTRPLVGLGLSAGAALLTALFGMASVWWTFVWFPWLIVAAAQLPLAVAWCTLARLDPRGRTEDAGVDRQPPEVAATVSAPPAVRVPVIPDYDVLGRIGKGAYGEVWLCRSTSDIYRAVKVVRRADFQDDKPYEREFAGVRAYEPFSLSHDSLLRILHLGRRDEEGCFYYIMELGDDVQRGTVVDPKSYQPRNLAEDIATMGRLPVPECLALGERLAAALEVLHAADLRHRDIKPSNIIFVNGVPKFADIGLVAVALRGEAVQSIVGTIGYMAPEGPGSPSADVFGLGKVLYEANNGIAASDYPDLPPTSLERPDWNERRKLNDLIFKACELDPGKRYVSAAEFGEALKTLRIELSNSPDSAAPGS